MGNGIVRVEAWKKFSWLVAGFSTRQGGRSKPYATDDIGEQNLGWTPDDDDEIVAENRRSFVRSLTGKDHNELITLRQIHGSSIHWLRRGINFATEPGCPVPEGDGLTTWETGVLLGVQTADCAPVLIADTRTRAVAAFHAGWRGTLARIVEVGVSTMQRDFHSRPEELIAAIGPSIGPCCFAVGEDLRSKFRNGGTGAKSLFAVDVEGTLHMDLWEANRQQLLDSGLPSEAITLIGHCTVCKLTDDGRRKYFSHRAEHGFTGRMLSVVGTI